MTTGPDPGRPSRNVPDRIATLNRLIDLYASELAGPQPDPFHEDGGHLTGRLEAILADLIAERDTLCKRLGEPSDRG